LCLFDLQNLTVDVTTDFIVEPSIDPLTDEPIAQPHPGQSAVNFPDSLFAGLTALTALRANIANKMLPESFGSQLGRLQQLQLTCASLTSLPGSICRLSQLRVLRLHCAQQLQQLPAALGSLPVLQELQLGGLGQPMQLPASLVTHTALTALHISGCPSIDNAYTKVDGLCAASMPSLQQLLPERCRFSGVLELGGASLQQLAMKHCGVRSIDVSGGALLQQLTLADMADFRHIHGVEDLACLVTLDVR
jgi:hypothetical protein